MRFSSIMTSAKRRASPQPLQAFWIDSASWASLRVVSSALMVTFIGLSFLRET